MLSLSPSYKMCSTEQSDAYKVSNFGRKRKAQISSHLMLLLPSKLNTFSLGNFSEARSSTNAIFCKPFLSNLNSSKFGICSIIKSAFSQLVRVLFSANVFKFPNCEAASAISFTNAGASPLLSILQMSSS